MSHVSRVIANFQGHPNSKSHIVTILNIMSEKKVLNQYYVLLYTFCVSSEYRVFPVLFMFLIKIYWLRFKSPLSHQLFITDPFNAVVLLWFSVAWFWCQSFGDVSPYICSYYFSSVWVAEWPPFEKELPTQLTISSLAYFDYL